MINPYCRVANGLTDAGCDIDPTLRMITISGWQGDYTYSDVTLNLIKVVFDIENPTTAGLSSEEFSIETYYNRLNDSQFMDKIVGIAPGFDVIDG